MKQLSNAIVFKATLPSIEAMRSHVEKLMFTPISSNSVSCAGFFANEFTAEVVNELVGVDGYTFQIRLDEKVLPAQVIKQKVKERVESYEKREGFPLSRKQKAEIKDEIILDLLPTALVKTNIINAYYETKSKYLVVDTTSKSIAQLVITMLIKCCDSVKTETININSLKLGVSAKLQSHLSESDSNALEGFELGHYCRLVKRGTKEKSIYENSSIDSIGERILEELNDGFEVDLLNLDREGVDFKLTDKFHFKAIRFVGFKLNEDCKDDKAYSFRYEAGVKMLMLVDTITATCDLVGYREDSTEEQECDNLYDNVVAYVKEERRASVSGIQRKFMLGYNRAARIVEQMEANGIVSAPGHNGNREVLI